jgi:hypothetical protein
MSLSLFDDFDSLYLNYIKDNRLGNKLNDLITTPYKGHLEFLKRKHSCMRGKSQAELNKWLTGDKIRFAVETLRKVELVSTVYKKEELQKTSDFYYPSQVYCKKAGSEGSFIADNYLDFKSSNGIIIEGTVGQGKSIFLRHLHNHELSGGCSVPIFIELKDIDDSNSIIEYLLDYISHTLELRCSKPLFNALLKAGVFSFYLDGFDEVEHDKRHDIVSFICLLNNKSSSSKIYVTSRPDNEVQRATGFDVFCIKPLDDDEQIGFVKRLMASEESLIYGDYLRKNIINLSQDLRALLQTPLMLTLFSMVYRKKVKIPENHSDFYKKLFDTLVSEHDGLKLGFTRPTKTGFSAEQIKTALELISFKAIKDGELSGNKDEFIRRIKKVLIDMGEKVIHATNLLEDLTKNTCLLQLDNHNYKFLHDTIPHYFAASCITNQTSDKDAIQFYDSSRDKWNKWLAVLCFLSDIDERRFIQNLYLPEVQYLFEPSLLPRKLKFTRESAKLFSRNIYLGSMKPNSKKGNRPEDDSAFLFFRPVTGFIIHKHFVSSGEPSDLGERVDLSKLIELVKERLNSIEDKKLASIIKKFASESKSDTYFIRMLSVERVFDEIGLNEWFYEAINKIPLDNFKTTFNKNFEFNKRREEHTKSGKFSA